MFDSTAEWGGLLGKRRSGSSVAVAAAQRQREVQFCRELPERERRGVVVVGQISADSDQVAERLVGEAPDLWSWFSLGDQCELRLFSSFALSKGARTWALPSRIPSRIAADS